MIHPPTNNAAARKIFDFSWCSRPETISGRLARFFPSPWWSVLYGFNVGFSRHTKTCFTVLHILGRVYEDNSSAHAWRTKALSRLNQGPTLSSMLFPTMPNPVPARCPEAKFKKNQHSTVFSQQQELRIIMILIKEVHIYKVPSFWFQATQEQHVLHQIIGNLWPRFWIIATS